MLFIIISSIVFSVNVYNSALTDSSFRKDNPISVYLTGHTDRNTLVIIDDHNMDFLSQTAELALYGYWNNGDCIYGNGQDPQAMSAYDNRSAYIVTTASLPYKQIANDEQFKLYSIH